MPKNVCYITDDNYAMPTVVSAFSLLKHTKCNIFVIGVNLSSKSRETLAKIPEIKLLEYENKYENLTTIETYVTKAAFFKFDLPEIFKNLDEILFLDSDTIILDDISPVFNIKFEAKTASGTENDPENVLKPALDAQNPVKDTKTPPYAAVVVDFIGIKRANALKRLNLSSYFYSGVMYLNLKKMREDEISKKLLETKIASPPDFLDQEIFNLVFNENVKFISPEYNFVPPDGVFSLRSYKKFFNIKKISPKILHMIYLKPWKYKNVPYERVWHKFYNEIFANEISNGQKLDLKPNPNAFKIYKKRKFNDRWVIDFLGIRLSYEKGGRNFRLFYP